MYILDAEKVPFSGLNKLTEEQIELIDNDAILDRVTRTPQSESLGYVYPPETEFTP